MTRAVADYFSKHTNFTITFGAIDDKSGKDICYINPKRFRYEIINVISQPKKAVKLAKEHDIVMSLVPPPLHKYVAQACIDAEKNMVTSSYISKGINVFF